MAVIKKYKKKDGSTAYMFNAYLGVDPLTGKSKRTTRRGFRTQKEAGLALAQLQIEVESGSFVKQHYQTFKDVYELWFENYKLNVKETTAIRLKFLFDNEILPKFENKRINKITTATCQRVSNEWLADNAPSRLRSYTSKVFRYAVSINLIQYNPMDNIIVPRKQTNVPKKEAVFLDREELKSFLNDIKSKESEMVYVMFHTLAYTGLRKGELAALNWTDIDFEKNTLSITKTAYYLSGEQITTTPKTLGSTREISLDSSTIALLKKWKLTQKKEMLSRGIRAKKEAEQLIFSDYQNRQVYNSFLNQVLHNYSSYNITPHGFRHTHASLLFEAGASIKQVQERLGHSNIKTTMEIYTHVTKEAEKETADKFLKYMNL
ncbi:hypothetical protein IGI37_000055 [Enterococcus sp. AZ194]|uniref:site-specific integrase n=1 Tax=Enterococcus sp. AZ194 TaxID=2774629 RepID=UPI003F1E6E72